MITMVADYKDLTFVVAYYIIYNLSVLICFLLICRFGSSNFRTMSDLKKFGEYSILNACFIVVLLSMAGVPPFLGFFTKILIVKSLFNSGVGAFLILFLIITFVSLFFYLQNIRFLLTPTYLEASSSTQHSSFALLLNTYLLIIGMLILILGGLYINDLLILTHWLL